MNESAATADGASSEIAPLPGIGRAAFFDAVGDGIAVVFLLRGAGPDSVDTVGCWLHVGADGQVTAHTGKVEVGQGIRTSLTQLVAEELRVPIEAVRLVMGDTTRTPFDIGTFSSLTIRTIGTQLRRVAAVARELLLRLTAEAGAGSGYRDGGCQEGGHLELGSLVAGRRILRTVSRTDAVTPPPQWTVAGKALPKVDGHAFVTGRHRYASDLTLPGMLFGKVLRPPAHGAALVSVDTREAEAMPGVTVVREEAFVGVAAPEETRAALAVAAVSATWSAAPQPSHPELFASLRRDLVDDSGRDGAVAYAAGSLDRGLRAAATTLRATYTTEFIAHAPMEPRAALAQWVGGCVTVWTATQRPFSVRGELAEAFGIPVRDVRVIVPDAGSAFGGKHTGEVAVEAARLARATDRPVRVMWTRAEEFSWGYFRPAAVIDIAAGLGRDGALTAWEFQCYNAGAEAIRPPYHVPHQRVAFQPARAPLRQGPYRGMAATANTFARETHLDELARLGDMDPLELRRRNLTDPRLRAVLDAAADAFGWGRRQPAPGHGFGIACGSEKGGYVAACAEVAVDGCDVSAVRVVQAFECGAIVNPDHLAAQVEGAVIQGLGGALFEAVDFGDGRILNPDFARYRVPRFADVPAIEVVLLDRRDLPSAGAGETPIVCVAPALGNAIFDATGIRLRALPLAPHGLPDS